MTDSQSKYHQLCKKEEGIPFFSQAWWFDAVCGAQWDVVFHYDKNGVIQGAFPFGIRTQIGIKFLNTPRRSPFSGLWIRQKQSEKHHSRISHYRAVSTSLINELPKHHFAQFKLSPDIEDWYPFFLKGFSEKIRYTYLLDISIKKEELLKNFHKRVRKEIKPFQEQLVVSDSIDLDVLHITLLKSFENQKDSLNIDKKQLHKINSAAGQRGKAIMLTFSDKDNRPVGSIYGIIENRIFYGLFTGMDKNGGGRGMFSFIIWKLIEYLKEKNIEKIDFCGSMIPEIERRLRHFNARQEPYHLIWHGNNKLLNYFFWKRYIK